MAFLHELTIVGNLTRDPELRYMSDSSGTPVLTVSVAVNDDYRKNGEWVKGDTWYYNVPYFGEDRVAEMQQKDLHKGDTVWVRGTPKYRIWEDNEGKSRIGLELRFPTLRIWKRKNAAQGDFDAAPSEAEATAEEAPAEPAPAKAAPAQRPTAAAGAKNGRPAPKPAARPSKAADVDPDDMPF